MKELFVCVFGRNRDNYEVPIALLEADILDCLVTDFYYDDRSCIASAIPSKLKERQHPALPKSSTMNVYPSFLLQLLFSAAKLPLSRIYPTSDRILGAAAAVRAFVTGSHLYGYAGYSIPKWIPLTNRAHILFQYHPHPAYMQSILRADLAAHPEASWSFENEEDSTADASDARYSDWKRADFIVCASATTKRSLLFAGCPEEKISVIPYGFDRTGACAAYPQETAAECRFLFVGQGIQRKGLHHLIKAWNSANIPNASLTLVCYRIDPGIECLIDPARRVTLLRRQTPAELDQHYAQSDVFIMPSLIEGFGLVYLEALQRGCFVIGTENTGLSDLDLSHDCHELVEAGNIESIRAALMRASTRHAARGFDRASIAENADRRPVAVFRRDIVEHAQSVLRGYRVGRMRRSSAARIEL
ncbi:MAG TPA: glycosyltransferase family 4 protein [Candidatus Binataceae bacterium]|nr:glycosyltransferase family 4 protein [Candidatus Binataceae bacterium]